jgi:hypothetical protein
MRKSVCYNSITLYIILICCTCVQQSVAQQQTSLADKIIHFPDKVFAKIDQQAAAMEEKMNRQTERYLSKLQRQEEKLKRKLWETDSTKAKELFGDVQERYNQLRHQLTAKANGAQSSASNMYNGHMDSVNTAIRFLQEVAPSNSPQGGGLNVSSSQAEKIKDNLSSVTNLQSKLNQTELIRKQIAQRQQQLKQQLQNTPLMKEFTKYRKQVYYYQQQVIDYKEALNDPKQLGAKLLETAMKFPAFKQFFANNSELASLFQIPGATPSPSGSGSVAYGLQTRATVMQELQTRFGTITTPAANVGTGGSYFQQQMQSAQSEIRQVQDRVMKRGTNNNEANDEDLGFVPDQTKTKSLKQRLVFSSNVQTTRGRGIFVNSADVGISIGVKLNDKSVVGIGGSYRAGFGTGFNNIHLSNEGMSYRSYLDWKPSLTFLGQFGKSIWVSGAFERNYFAVLNRTDAWQDVNAWKTSLLLGASKVVDVRSKFFKKTKLSILYDFNWRTPGNVQTQPVVFRINYQF